MEATCHEWISGFWWNPSNGLRMPLFVSYCDTCGAALRPDGTSGPAAAELEARLAAAEKDARRLDALEKKVADDGEMIAARVVDGGADEFLCGLAMVHDHNTVAIDNPVGAPTLRALADALEVDAQ